MNEIVVVVEMDVQTLAGGASVWQAPNFYAASAHHPALVRLRSNGNELHTWFHHSRKPSMDEVANPNSVNSR